MPATSIWKNSRLPILVGLAAGLYPLLFYYSNNYPLINTWKHLGFFICLFLLLPIGSCFLVHLIARKEKYSGLKKYLLPFFSIGYFLIFLQISFFAGLQLWYTIGIIAIAVLSVFLLRPHLAKIMFFQFVLAVIGLFTLVPTLIKQFNYSDAWMEQPDDIEQAVFTKKPNVYFIEPDGYVNFSEIDKGFYQIDNEEFKSFLQNSGFTLYDDFRSNYNSTIESNMATFAMKHHYYNSGFNFSEAINGREIIVGSNPVLEIFKKNGYKTHFIAEWPYLIANQPELGYEYSNFTNKDVSLIGTGYTKEKEVFTPLAEQIDDDPGRPKFFFVQIFKPGHVPSTKDKTQGAAKEKELWIERLRQANKDLTKIMNIIRDKDPNSIIIMMADHGGDIGMDYTLQMRKKSMDRNRIYTVFSSQLAVHWPGGEAPEYDDKLKTPVNFFRVLFSYLTENESYLEHLEDDISMLIIEEDAPKGVYTCIDEEGNVIFDKI